MRRILLSGLLGGLAMFVAGTITHVVLPLGEVGIKRLPNEDPVLTALRDNVKEPGLYFFPAMAEGATAEQRKQWEQRCQSGPSGLLSYRPRGGEAMTPRQLGTELLSNVLAALLAAWLLAKTALPRYGARVLFVAALGLLVVLAVHVSYWNWYGFPAVYVLAELGHEATGFAATGLVLARFVKT